MGMSFIELSIPGVTGEKERCVKMQGSTLHDLRIQGERGTQSLYSCSTTTQFSNLYFSNRDYPNLAAEKKIRTY